MPTLEGTNDYSVFTDNVHHRTHNSQKIATNFSGNINLFAADSLFLQVVAAVLPNDAMSAKLTVKLRVGADEASCEALLAVTIFVLFAIK